MNLAGDLTVCICTRDRLEDLEQALGSIQENAPGAAIVVSDDGTTEAASDLAKRYPRCRWQRGPATGLGANRNAAVAAVETDWILFLDDDARLGEDFVRVVEARLKSLDETDRAVTIITGRERNNGVLVEPRDVDFLGFQRVDYRPGDELHTVVINAAVWPRRMFDRVSFDQRLRYGSDEVDLSYAALAAGYRIESCPDAVNEHFPAASGRDEYALDSQAARLRATTKRYWKAQRRPARTVAFLAIAVPHLLLAMLKRDGLRGLSSFFAVISRWARR